MSESRWLHLAVGGMTVVLAAVLLLSTSEPWRIALGLGALAAFAGGWFAIGRHAQCGGPRLTLLFTASTATVALASGVATAVVPNLATIQCVAYPLVWLTAFGVRRALLGNLAIAACVWAGFLVALGTATGTLVQTAITMGLTLGFSLALGLWITHITSESDQRRRLLDELRAAQDQVAALHRDAGVLAERERLAREIHDTIAQSLTGLVLLAQQAQLAVEADNAANAGRSLAALESSAREALVETRSLVAAHAPVALDAGLAPALRRLAERVTRESGIDVSVAGTAPTLPRDAEVVLLRSAQEGVANVRKHSGAHSARIEVGADASTVRLTVRDDGHGFDPATAASGFGLPGLRDRLALAGGTLAVSSGRSGTVLTAVLPLALADGARAARDALDAEGDESGDTAGEAAAESDATTTGGTATGRTTDGDTRTGAATTGTRTGVTGTGPASTDASAGSGSTAGVAATAALPTGGETSAIA